jgi:tRNA (cytidine/uridine-2'-O-)-methyltransferase
MLLAQRGAARVSSRWRATSQSTPSTGTGVRNPPILWFSSAPVVSSLHVILVEPEIHWNTGNIGRTTLAVGADLHLVEPLGFSLDDHYLHRAGLDYWPRVRLRVWPSWAAIEEELPGLGEPFFFSSQGARSFWEVAYPDDVALVFGRESVGLPEDLLARHAARTLRIPMAERNMRSLNLSTTVGVAVFEVARQRAGACP